LSATRKWRGLRASAAINADRKALAKQGYANVKVCEVPPWMRTAVLDYWDTSDAETGEDLDDTTPLYYVPKS
jgi:hypothetical protein